MDFSLSFSLKEILLKFKFIPSYYWLYASKVETSTLTAQLMYHFYFLYGVSIVRPTDFWIKKQRLEHI